MRLRGFAPGCQPVDGLLSREEGKDGYYDVLTYKRRLTAKEIEDYELDDLNKDPKSSLARIREEKGLRQRELAENIGVPVRTFEGWEFNGIGKLNFNKVMKIASVLGCTAEDLYDGEVDE
jgi:DNA-binding XRE family transcriptional regulator